MALIDIKRELDVLFATSPSEFVASRNALVKRLKSAGLGDLAIEVKGLARPTPTCWAVNRLALDAPDVLDGMIEAGRALRVAQQSSPRELDTAKASHRAAIAGAVDHATALLTAEGYAPNALATRRLRETLEALASGSADGEAGRLSRDLEPPGFDAFELAQRAGIAKEARDAAVPNAVARRRSSHSLAAVVGRRRHHQGDDASVDVARATSQAGLEPRRAEGESPKRPGGGAVADIVSEDTALHDTALHDTALQDTVQQDTVLDDTPTSRGREERHGAESDRAASDAADDARERHAVLAEALAAVETAYRRHQLEVEEAEALVAGLRSRLERAEETLVEAAAAAASARDKRDRVKRQTERAEAELRALEAAERAR